MKVLELFLIVGCAICAQYEAGAYEKKESQKFISK